MTTDPDFGEGPTADELRAKLTREELEVERRQLAAVGLYLGAPLPHYDACRCSQHPNGRT